MGAFKNLVGLRFERLVVKADSGRRDKHGDIFGSVSAIVGKPVRFVELLCVTSKS